MFDRKAYEEKIRWFVHDRFGMFIHWGLYAIPARGEWVRSIEELSTEDYQIYFDEFNPVDYDPVSWAKAAKQTGVKYAVMTAKHHDGFCLFDSELTDYKATNTPAGRDLIREYIDAFRAQGIKIGLYYSLIDWHHPDFPHYGDRHHPMRNNPDFQNVKHNFDRYLTYMHGQIKELCTNYGKIDLFWFDFSYDNLTGEAWKATELVRMIRKYQPHVLMDNRLEVSGEGFGSLITADPSEFSGDFVSPEQIIPPYGILDQTGNPVTWEACVTMNNNWGYHAKDHNFKSSEMIIKKIVECTSKNGNLLLNVGPDAKGNIPKESLQILKEIGEWMKGNQNSIYGCGASNLQKPDYGRITQNGNKLYYHVMESLIGYIPLTGICAEQVKKIRLLETGAELKIANDWITGNYSDIVFVSLGENPNLPNPIDTVIEVELKETVHG